MKMLTAPKGTALASRDVCAGVDWLEMLAYFSSPSYVYIRSLKINNSHFHHLEKKNVFLCCTRCFCPWELSYTKHFTVNTRAECKCYILNYAIKYAVIILYVTGTNIVVLNTSKHTVNSWLVGREAGIQVMLWSNNCSRSGKQSSACCKIQASLDGPLPMTPAHLGREMGGWKKIS